MKQCKHAPPTQAELLQLFWSAPDEAMLPTKIIAAGLGLSPTTLEIYRIRGKGPAFEKRGRNVFTRKRAALDWHDANSRKAKSTSDLKVAANERQ